MSTDEKIISELAYLVSTGLAPGAERPAVLREADDYLHARGWFTPERGDTHKTRERKITKFQLCDRHRPWFSGETRRRQIECMVEGGPGGWTPGCEGGCCKIWPGRDVFEPSVCHDELPLEWTAAAC